MPCFSVHKPWVVKCRLDVKIKYLFIDMTYPPFKENIVRQNSIVFAFQIYRPQGFTKSEISDISLKEIQISYFTDEGLWPIHLKGENNIILSHYIFLKRRKGHVNKQILDFYIHNDP